MYSCVCEYNNEYEIRGKTLIRQSAVSERMKITLILKSEIPLSKFLLWQAGDGAR